MHERVYPLELTLRIPLVLVLSVMRQLININEESFKDWPSQMLYKVSKIIWRKLLMTMTLVI